MSLRYTIYYRDDPPTIAADDAGYDDGWTLVDNTLLTDRVILTDIEYALAPAYSTAKLQHHYGLITGDGSTVVAPALNLLNKFIRIKLQDEITKASTEFLFVCKAAADDVYGHHVDPVDAVTRKPGINYYTCYDLSWFMARETLDRAITDKGTIRSALNFNQSATDRDDIIVGNRSAAKSGKSYVFAAAPESTWSVTDILEYILRICEDDIGVTIHLHPLANDDFLGNITDIFTGATDLRSLLNAILSPERGYNWHIDRNYLMINTNTDVAIDDGATVPVTICPINNFVIDFDIGDDADFTDAVRVTHLDNAYYHTVSVQGERLRVLATFRASDALASGWAAGDESDYNAAPVVELERPKYDAVYRRFIIDDPWDGETDGNNAFPIWDATAGLVDADTKQVLYLGELVFDRTIPIADNEGQWRKPFLLAQDPTNGEYFLVHKPGDGREASVLSLLDDAPGISIEPPYNHLFASGSYTGASPKVPKYAFSTFVLTAAYYTPERVRIDVDSDLPLEQVNQTKVINLPGHHYWWQAANTVTGHDADGLITAAPSAVLRDDTPSMRRVANLAKLWYCRKRAKLSINYAYMRVIEELGNYVTETDTGGSIDPAGTVVSRISYRFGKDTITGSVETDYRDIDLEKIAAIRTSRRQTARQRAANPDPELFANTPVSPAVMPLQRKLPKVTYDAAASNEFTVVTPIYEVARVERGGGPWTSDELNEPAFRNNSLTSIPVTPYKFAKLGGNYTVDFGIHKRPNLTLGDNEVMTWRSTTASVTTDAATLSVQSPYPADIGLFHPFFSITFNSDGTYSLAIADAPIDFIYSQSEHRGPVLTWDAVSRSILLHNARYYGNGSQHALGPIVIPSAPDGELPIASDIVLASTSGIWAFDLASRISSPDFTGPVLGRIEVDSAGVVTLWRDESEYLHVPSAANLLYGESATIPSTATITAVNGAIKSHA